MVVEIDGNTIHKGPSQLDKLQSDDFNAGQDRDLPRADHDVVMVARSMVVKNDGNAVRKGPSR